ncbi:MAG: MFS transporter [Planctomycetota bacterium]
MVFGRPRVLVATLACTELVSWGILYYAFGVLVAPMQAELGWSQGLLGGGLSLALFVSALLAVPVGRWIERVGPRLVMTVGTLAGALALWSWSHVAHPFPFYALMALLGVALACSLYEPAFATVVGTLGPSRRTDFALLVLTIVGGFASTVFMPVTQALVARDGWRAALASLALVLLVATGPAHALVLPSALATSAGSAPSATPPPPLERPRLLRLALANLLGTLASTSLGVFLVAHLLERGHGAEFAALAASMIGCGQVAGRIGFTLLFPRRALSSWNLALFLTPALGLAVLAGDASAPLVLAAVFTLAMASGAQTLARASFALALFPAQAFTQVNAVLGRWSLFGRAGAPLALGLLHDASGTHGPGFWTLAGLCVCAAGAASSAARGHR